MENSFTPKRQKVEILKPECNLETVRDGRGGIFKENHPNTFRAIYQSWFSKSE